MTRDTMRRPPSLKSLTAAVEAWNARYPVGCPVMVRKDDGRSVETKTRSKAKVLSGHSAVIWLDGISGCYLLNRVTPITEDRGEAPREAGDE